MKNSSEKLFFRLETQHHTINIEGEINVNFVHAFYKESSKIFQNYFLIGNSTLTANFKIDSFNYDHSCYMIKLLKQIKKYQRRGKDITVNWYYHREQAQMKQLAGFYNQCGRLELNLIPR